MTLFHCLMVLVMSGFLTTVAPAHVHATLSPVTPSHGAPDVLSESEKTTRAPLHVTLSGSSGSQGRAQKLETISFEHHRSEEYEPGQVVVAGGSDASDSGSAATAPSDFAFDLVSSLDQILDFFANATALPEPSSAQHETAGNASSTSSSSSGSSPSNVVEPEKTEESVFDHDASGADKPVVPSPPLATTASAKPESAFQSAAMIAKICDVAFVAIALSVVVLH